MYLYSYLSFTPAPLLDIFSFYVCLGQLSRNRSLGGDIKSFLTQLACRQCYRPLARVVIHFFYPQCPAPAFCGSLTGYWATCLVGHISEDNPSFPGPQPLCPCSVPGPSYPLIRVLFNFPNLTGTKPACLFGGFRSRSTSRSSFFFLLSLCAPAVFPVPVIRCQSFIN